MQTAPHLSTNCKIKSLDWGLQLDLPLSIGNRTCTHMYSPTAKSPWVVCQNKIKFMVESHTVRMICIWNIIFLWLLIATWESIHTVIGSLSCPWYFGFSLIIGARLIKTSGFLLSTIAKTTNIATCNSRLVN